MLHRNIAYSASSRVSAVFLIQIEVRAHALLSITVYSNHHINSLERSQRTSSTRFPLSAVKSIYMAARADYSLLGEPTHLPLSLSEELVWVIGCPRTKKYTEPKPPFPGLECVMLTTADRSESDANSIESLKFLDNIGSAMNPKSPNARNIHSFIFITACSFVRSFTDLALPPALLFLSSLLTCSLTR